jgi:predicted porin
VADEIAGEVSGGEVHRIQVGGGYWLTKNMLTKAEYVYQTLADFDDDDGSVAGVRAADDPYFHGLILEVSFAF